MVSRLYAVEFQGAGLQASTWVGLADVVNAHALVFGCSPGPAHAILVSSNSPSLKSLPLRRSAPVVSHGEGKKIRASFAFLRCAQA